MLFDNSAPFVILTVCNFRVDIMGTKLLLVLVALHVSLGLAELCQTKRYLLLDSEDVSYKSCPGPGDPDHFTQCCPGPSWTERSDSAHHCDILRLYLYCRKCCPSKGERRWDDNDTNDLEDIYDLDLDFDEAKK